MKIVYFGSGAFGLPTLQLLQASPHQLVGVVSQPDRPAGRGRHLEPTPVTAWALERQVPLWRTPDANAPESLAWSAARGADCFVVIAFGQKLGTALLTLPPHGAINLHSSLLPRYRGAAPINWALLNNDAQTGVTVLRVSPVMDGGDILAADRTPIGPAETAGELHDRLAALGAPLVRQVLDGLAAGTLAGVPQDPAARTSAPKLSRAMAWVDFAQDAPRVAAHIRGLSPWPGCSVHLFDATGKLRTAATVLKCQANATQTAHPPELQGHILADRTVACGTGAIELLQIQPTGKKPMDSRAFANGYGMAPGARLVSVIAPPSAALPET